MRAEGRFPIVAGSDDRELAHDQFQLIFGPVRALSPTEALDLFVDAPFRWWVAGGWSTELTAGQRRSHDDLEVGIPRADLPKVRDWLRDYHLWDVHDGTLRFVWPDTEIPRDHEQLWVRRDGHSPWLLDLMLTPVEGDTWFYKRDRRVNRKMRDVLRIDAAGVPFQRPEITLLYKARPRRAKDETDFAAVAPLLAATDRAWLREAIALTEPPDHPWLRQL